MTSAEKKLMEPADLESGFRLSIQQAPGKDVYRAVVKDAEGNVVASGDAGPLARLGASRFQASAKFLELKHAHVEPKDDFDEDGDEPDDEEDEEEEEEDGDEDDEYL